MASHKDNHSFVTKSLIKRDMIAIEEILASSLNSFASFVPSVTKSRYVTSSLSTVAKVTSHSSSTKPMKPI